MAMIEKLLSKENKLIALIWLIFSIFNAVMILPKSLITSQLWIIIAYNHLGKDSFYFLISIISMLISFVILFIAYKIYNTFRNAMGYKKPKANYKKSK
jgi:hypothetical protein